MVVLGLGQTMSKGGEIGIVGYQLKTRSLGEMQDQSVHYLVFI
jgi:hypothetical protein